MTPAPYLEIRRFGRYVDTIRNDVMEQIEWIAANVPHPDFMTDPYDAPDVIKTSLGIELGLGLASAQHYTFIPKTSSNA